ncbi:diguanylate cyclase [Agrococcus sp. SCSIO52902]|uniref:diguanylate cyclase domain-containing protein n=1 Tax=Agrococcus sp. SCSIO52902 TaxID=2933290 RepID=UPI001FF2A897|nr:diguanylate cyclase [Agrococcus sp. SCSIO52902]UOW00484.1 diguanylate cyclase [Agrococcus sp. SCSIO52902]
MTLDPDTVRLITALVVHVAGGLFVLETMVRKDDRAGRVWALGFIGGMIATEAFIVYTVSEGSWWPLAIGNAAWVACLGLLWLGCRVFNGRAARRPAYVLGATVALVFLAALIDVPLEGAWSGAWVMFAANAAFGALGAFETFRRGAMRRTRTALGLGVVLALASVFQAVRLVSAVTLGTEHPVFQEWVSSGLAGVATICLSIVAVTVASVLRAEQVRLRGTEDSTLMAIAPDGVLLAPSFSRVLGGRLMRANRRAELFGVLVVRIDALSRIATAFGADEADHVRQAARAAVRRLSPTTAALGTDDHGILMLAFQPSSPADARQLAARMHRAMLDQMRTAGVPVVPPIGMGVSLTSITGYDREALIEAARSAARRAMASDDVTVVVAGEDDETDQALGQAVRR